MVYAVPMRILALIALMGLGGCGDPAEQYALQMESEYQLVKDAGGDAPERCEAARRVEEAWRATLDSEKYRQAKLSADITCRRAEQQVRLGF